jgi:starch phosphorylase
MPTYSGGLGVLAGDSLRAATDLGIPMVAVTLLHRKGYFCQHLDERGNQTESPASWSPEQFLKLLPARASIRIEDRSVTIQAWRYIIHGISGHTLPVYFLDTALESNSPWDRTLTDHLYGGDDHYGLCQEMVLGLGGVLMLRALGQEGIRTYHMNEGHSALLILGLLRAVIFTGGMAEIIHSDVERLRQHCVFTTHTPVPAGHDQFPEGLVRQVLGNAMGNALVGSDCCLNRTLNMTYLALFFSRYVNGVAMRHGEVSRSMFPNYPINSITNGVHAVTWTADAFQRLYDRHFPEWRRDNLYLRYAVSIPPAEIQQAHAEARQALLDEVKRRRGIQLDPAVLTLGFARRAATFKQADLLLTDLERLRRIVRQAGPLQVVYAGKAHPHDGGGKAVIRRVYEAAAALGESLRVVYLEDYDMALAKILCSGADLWLNTPQKPKEASGTSGMKAALNGVPSLSILDGWWLEGHLEGITGWSVGEDGDPLSNPAQEATSLYNKLEYVILPLFYGRPHAYAKVMRSAIAVNGSFFNAQRMVGQYLKKAYLAAGQRGESEEGM